MTRFPYGKTIVLHTRTQSGFDGYGNDEFTTVDTTIEGCAFDPGESTELVQGQDTVISNPRVFLPAGAPVPAAFDQVTVDGVTYDVDGKPRAYDRHPMTGTDFGTIIYLESVSG